MRRIPLSRRSHIIGFQPLPTGTAEHESALERDFVTLTSFLDPTASITSQPITITFQDGFRTRRYTPDFLVRRDISPTELVEVKYRVDLRANRNRLRPAFAAARAWAHEHAAVFRIATERGIRGARLNNAKRLLALRQAPLDSDITALVLDLVRAQSTPTFGGVLEALPLDRRVGLSILWSLIARHALQVDLSSPITHATQLSLP
ncbi:MAG: TnsA endonuclease N-terminal domain-containing protein [Steroidobacteraceae bacterium]